MIEKEFIGEDYVCEQQIKYYVINKEQYYGVRLEAKTQKEDLADEVYFTEDKAFAYHMGHKMKEGQVTLVGMCEVLDEWIA